MRRSACETMIWLTMAPAAWKYLKEAEPDRDIPGLKRKTREIYRKMISRTPDIGSLKENSLRVCQAAGMLWLSFYEATEGSMSEECFAGMVDASMNAPLVKKSFRAKGKLVFTRSGQEKRREKAVQGNAAPGGDFNWNTDVLLGRDADEYTILYHRCGLCALGRQEGLPFLVPYMCAVDTMSVDWTGGRLYRTQTLASGGEVCDFYICKKNSHWDRKRQGELGGKDI